MTMTVKIHDLRPKTPRSNRTRDIGSVKRIARHHSATSDGDWAHFWEYWKNTKKWGTGGYHEIILRDGSVQICYDPNEITNGVGGQNADTYHICVVGNGSFTDAQERTWEERALFNMKRLSVPVNKVLGHKEFPGAQTACPGIDMGMVRNRLTYLKIQGETPKPKPPAPAKPVVKPPAKTIYKVQVGAYSVKQNAESVVKALKAKGFDAVIVEGGK